MALLKKSKEQQPEQPAGRRRPDSMQGRPDAARPGGAMFSYYSQRSASQSNVGRREPVETVSSGRTPLFALGMGKQRILTFGIAVAALAALAYASMLTIDPRVVLLEDDATAYFLQDNEAYRRTAQHNLESTIFNRSKLTVDTTSLRLALLKAHPEVRNVSVALPVIGHNPQVYIEPYRPSFILTTVSSNAFLLDSTGRALAHTNQIADPAALGVPTLQDKTGKEVTLGSRAVPGSTVSFVETVVKALKAKDVEIASMSLPAAAYQLDVAIAGQSYFVKFNLENDALQQAGTYLAVRNRLQGEKITPAQYIDVRVPDRAYYK